MNIALVGFSGSGKTTIGKKIAARLNLHFADLDAEIESKYHCTIPHLFEKYGEFAFRDCEYATLIELLKHDNLLIATGGGAPCFQDAMQVINDRSLSIYLYMSDKSLVDRLMLSKKERPLTRNKSEEELTEYVHNTLAIREPFFRKAKLTLEGVNFNLDDAIEAILRTGL